MNFGKFDVMMLLTMSLAVISMSFVFPAIGLAQANTGANDVPSFALDTQPLDLSGEFPDSPGTPTSGTMFLEANDTDFSRNQVWLDGDTSNGTEMVMLPATSSNDTAELIINDWDAGNTTTTRFNITGPSDTFVLNQYEYRITFEVTEFDESIGYQNAYYEIAYEVRNQPVTGGSWISRIPVVGGIVSTGQATAAVLGWFGSIFFWFLGTLIDIASAIIVTLFDVTTFLVSLVTWLVSTYAGIVQGAGAAWVSLFVALPGIILSLEFAKLGMIAASLLPTT